MSKNFPKLKGKAILSPMSGITDVAFRALAAKYGAAMTFAGFVNSTAVVKGNEKTIKLIETDKIEKPVGVQIFGNNPKEVAEAAFILEKKFDVIDFNSGCPAPNITRINAGSELLNKPKLLYDILSELSSVNKPVSVKIRIGVKNINAVRIAKLAERAGVSAITVHGRMQKQSYAVPANWNVIKKVKENVNIVVIGNGDVANPEIFKQKLEESGVDYIAIGRGAIGNPFLFKQINDYLKSGEYQKKKRLFSEYLKLAKKHDLPFNCIKRQAIYFSKGIFDATKLRNEIMKANCIEELKEIVEKHEM